MGKPAMKQQTTPGAPAKDSTSHHCLSAKYVTQQGREAKGCMRSPDLTRVFGIVASRCRKICFRLMVNKHMAMNFQKSRDLHSSCPYPHNTHPAQTVGDTQASSGMGEACSEALQLCIGCTAAQASSRKAGVRAWPWVCAW